MTGSPKKRRHLQAIQDARQLPEPKPEPWLDDIATSLDGPTVASMDKAKRETSIWNRRQKVKSQTPLDRINENLREFETLLSNPRTGADPIARATYTLQYFLSKHVSINEILHMVALTRSTECIHILYHNNMLTKDNLNQTLSTLKEQRNAIAAGFIINFMTQIKQALLMAVQENQPQNFTSLLNLLGIHDAISYLIASKVDAKDLLRIAVLANNPDVVNYFVKNNLLPLPEIKNIVSNPSMSSPKSHLDTHTTPVRPPSGSTPHNPWKKR